MNKEVRTRETGMEGKRGAGKEGKKSRNNKQMLKVYLSSTASVIFEAE